MKVAHHRQVTGNPPADAQRILAQYHAAYMDLQAVLVGIDRHLFDLPPGEDEWTIRRVYAHIVGAEMGFYVAIQFALGKLRGGEDPLIDIDDDTWLGIIGMEEEEIDAVMAETLPELQSSMQICTSEYCRIFLPSRTRKSRCFPSFGRLKHTA